jgi:gliding motility-associated protein GldL
MSTKNNNFVHTFYTAIMPKIYGIGAAIVIAGAMFKLLNWSGGALMLGVGLTTEAIIFFLSSFEPAPKEVDWTRVYPELDEFYTGTPKNHKHTDHDSISGKLDEMLSKAHIDQSLVDRLGQGMNTLAQSVNHISDLSQALKATEQYTLNIEKAANSLGSMYALQDNLITALDKMAPYTEQLQTGIQHLARTVNEVGQAYSIELKDIQGKMENTRAAYTNVTEAIDQLQDASQDTEKFRQELASLNQKLSTLNNVYGNMLMAFKS